MEIEKKTHFEQFNQKMQSLRDEIKNKDQILKKIEEEKLNLIKLNNELKQNNIQGKHFITPVDNKENMNGNFINTINNSGFFSLENPQKFKFDKRPSEIKNEMSLNFEDNLEHLELTGIFLIFFCNKKN